MSNSHGPGAVVWFTGLPASGKSTLASAVRERLTAAGRACAVLDSDDVRIALGESGYGRADRAGFYGLLGAIAAVLARQGLIVLVPATANRRAYRERARAAAPCFIEVYLQATLEECAERDPKGLYAEARAGRAPTLPGVGEPYEMPLAPDVIAGGGRDQAAVEAVLDKLGLGVGR